MARLLGLLIPGSWQLMRQSYGLGLFYFCTFTFCMNAYIFSPLLLPDNLTQWRYAFIILAAVVWLISSFPMLLPARDDRASSRPIPDVPDDPTDAEE